MIQKAWALPTAQVLYKNVKIHFNRENMFFPHSTVQHHRHIHKFKMTRKRTAEHDALRAAICRQNDPVMKIRHKSADCWRGAARYQQISDDN